MGAGSGRGTEGCLPAALSPACLPGLLKGWGLRGRTGGHVISSSLLFSSLPSPSPHISAHVILTHSHHSCLIPPSLLSLSPLTSPPHPSPLPSSLPLPFLFSPSPATCLTETERDTGRGIGGGKNNKLGICLHNNNNNNIIFCTSFHIIHSLPLHPPLSVSHSWAFLASHAFLPVLTRQTMTGMARPHPSLSISLHLSSSSSSSLPPNPESLSVSSLSSGGEGGKEGR